MNPPSLAAVLARLDAESKRTIRIETRLVRLMEHFGLDAKGSGLPTTPQEHPCHAKTTSNSSPT